MEWHFGSRTLLTRQIGFSPTQMNLPLLDTELQSAGKRWMLMPCGWQFPLSSFCVPVISSISYNSRSRLWNGYGMSNPSCINDHVSMRGYPELVLATRLCPSFFLSNVLLVKSCCTPYNPIWYITFMHFKTQQRTHTQSLLKGSLEVKLFMDRCSNSKG